MAEYAAAALLLYDYLLTLAAERRHIWKSRKTLVYFLFIGLRYSSIVHVLLSCIFDFRPKTCGKTVYILTLLDATRILCFSGIFILRSYAVWNRSLAVLTSLAIIALARTTVYVSSVNYHLPSSSMAVPSKGVCVDTSKSVLSAKLLQCSAWLVLLFDLLVAFLTISRTAQQIMNHRRLGIKMGLSYCICRDGVLYMVALVFWNILVLVSSRTKIAFLSYAETILVEVISSIMAQRLLLNLRQVNQELLCHPTTSKDNGQLEYAVGPALGSIGAPLRVPGENGSLGRAPTDDLESVR